MATKPQPHKIDPQALWSKYEDIAMHFNDLLMRLRTQSLGAVAAISTLVSIFANQGNTSSSQQWFVGAFLFVAMLLLWIAIFCLDFFYYNRLLNGSVRALTALERCICDGAPVPLTMSTQIEEEFTQGKRASATKGVLLFYGIVFAFLLGGATIFLLMSRPDEKAPRPPAVVATASPTPTPS
jgi:hypothetical protein